MELHKSWLIVYFLVTFCLVGLLLEVLNWGPDYNQIFVSFSSHEDNFNTNSSSPSPSAVPLLDITAEMKEFAVKVQSNDIFALKQSKRFASKSLDEFPSKYTMFLSFGNDAHFLRYSSALFSNVMYAYRQQVPFIIDQNTVTVPNNDQHYQKIYSIMRTFEKYPDCQQLVWIDSDTLILDKENIFFQTMNESPQKFQLVFTDHSNNLNNGVFLIRRSNWTMGFMNEWINLSEKYNGDFMFSDQGSMYILIMNYLNNTYVPPETAARCKYDGKCLTDVKIRRESIQYCMRDVMHCFGFPYNQRADMGKISILPQNNVRNRFNQWSFRGGRPYAEPEWINDDYYRAGDLITHSKDLDVFLTREFISGVVDRIDTKYASDISQAVNTIS